MADEQKYYAKGCFDKLICETYLKGIDKGTVIEVGAAKPGFLSQSKHLGDSRGWRRICVEPNPYFAEQHRKAGNEIYEYACSDHDEDDVTFQIVGQDLRDENNADMEGFSAIKIREDYVLATGYQSVSQLLITEIKVKVRKLDTIIAPLNLTSIDYVCVDTEGWELQVMKGFDIERWRPKVILLEDSFLNGNKYEEYMKTRGYVRGLRIHNNDTCYIPLNENVGNSLILSTDLQSQ